MSVLVDIKKNLGKFRLDVSFSADDVVHALLGASGCGKSMALKCIAGIVRPDEGRIVVDGETLFDSRRGINRPPQERRVGLLFQNYALFPNMTVEQNIACGMTCVPKGERTKALVGLLDLMVLGGLEKRFPVQLSGGQQQRVALARILASKPRMLMLDEPFSALDSHLRWQLEREVGALLRGFSGTTLLVSHDRDEVFRLCESITVLSDGAVSVSDRKRKLFERPRTLSAAVLTGCKNIAPAEKTGEHSVFVRAWNLSLTTRDTVPDNVRYVGLRAHNFSFCEDDFGENRFAFVVCESIEEPFSHILMVSPNENAQEALRCELPKSAYDTHMDQQKYLSISPEHVHLLTE